MSTDLDELDILAVLHLGRYNVCAARRELIFGVGDDALVVEVVEDRHETASVPIVGDAAAVVAFTSQV